MNNSQIKKTKDDIQNILNKVTVGTLFGKQSTWRLMSKGDGFLLQLTFVIEDVNTHKPELQSCRKWYISPYSTTSEVVETAFKAARTAIDHELKENFRYKGALVYNPHFDVEARIQMCEENRLDLRD